MNVIGGKALYSQDAETEVIGDMLIEGSMVKDVRAVLSKEDFWLVAHREIYSAICRLDDSGAAVDISTVCNYLDEHGKLQDVGGMPALVKCVSYSKNIYNARDHAKIVKGWSSRRRVADMAVEFAKAAASNEFDSQKFAAEKVEDLVKLAGGGDVGRSVHISEAVKEVREKFEEALENPGEVFGIPTGFSDLDHALGGLQKGEMMILTGKSGRGKSMLAGDLAFSIAKNVVVGGVPVAYFSLEMPRTQVARRRISSMSGVGTRLIKTGRVEGEDVRRVASAMDDLSENYRFYIDDTPDHDTMTIRAECARLVGEYGVQMAVVDYLGKVMFKGGSGHEEDYVREARVSSHLRDTARKLGIHILAVQRTVKAGMATGGVVRVEHTAGGSGVIFDADIIAALNDFIPDKEDPAQMAIPERDRKYMATLLLEKVREEALARWIHLVVKPGLPGFHSWEG